MRPPRRSAIPRHARRALELGRLVYLRYPEPEDLEEFVRVRRAGRAQLEPWEPLAPPGFDAFGVDGFRRELELRRTDSDERLLICAVDTGEIVGRLSLSGIVRGVQEQARFGYWTSPHAFGRGYMTEAVGLGLHHCFRRLRLHRVEADVQPHNIASRRVLEKNGFRLEGFSPRLVKIQGRWADHERWAITVEEWEPQG